MKVLVILGHPRRNSLCGALAAAYAEGARDGGAAVRTLDVGEMTFEPDVTGISPRDQPLEDSIRAAMAAIAWADHLVLVYPTWWGTMPAALKAFLDRVLLPGFAFADRDDGEGWERLLTGKSAHLLTTMDTPPWVYRWIYKAPGANALGRATLGFCGVDPVRITLFGPVKESTPARRAHWLEQARREGRALRRGVVRGKALLLRRIAAWTAALRLQFYPMTLIAYTLGALAAAAHGIAPGPYWTGFACLFLLEVATVLSNDLFDLPSDRLNRHAGPFSGGSRVLVEGRISPSSLKAGIAASLGLFGLAWVLLLPLVPAPVPASVLLALFTILALGYTAPPVRLSWRGLGEIDVGFTHSYAAILCGFVFQGGSWSDPLPWLAGTPLFLAVLPAIILAGVPDHDADRTAGKLTLTVRLGPRRAIRLAMVPVAAAAAVAVALEGLGIPGGLFAGIGFAVVPHALLLIHLMRRHLRRQRPVCRMDGLMAVALGYIVWFGALPLIRLL